MPSDGDLSGLLPPPPSPRPDAREAAIAAAMRRFDGEAPASPVPSRPARWVRLGGPRVGALVAAALMVTVGLPLWVARDHGPPPSPQRTPIAARTAPVAFDVAPPEQAPAAAPVEAFHPASAAKPAPAVEQPAVVASAPVAVAPLADVAEATPPAPQSPPPPAPVAAPEPPREQVRGFSLARQTEGGDAIAAMESRMSSDRTRAAAKAGAAREESAAWSACTIDDPAHDTTACGADGRDPGAAFVADGMTRAWQGDLPGAIDTFDRAIRASPRSSAAYLNRGLAHARAGADRRALADLDHAVRYAPGSARAYHYRAELLRRRGDVRRAEADERRAAELAD